MTHESHEHSPHGCIGCRQELISGQHEAGASLLMGIPYAHVVLGVWLMLLVSRYQVHGKISVCKS